VVLTERGLGGDDVDLAHRIDRLRRDRSRRAEDARRMAKRWAELASPASAQESGDAGVGSLLALAYPDRIAKSRGGGNGAFLLANGRGANVDPASALAREAYLAVAEITGSAAQGRMVGGAAIPAAELERRFGAAIEARDDIAFDTASASLRGRKSRRLGAITLAEQPTQISPGEATAQALAAGIARIGVARLPWTKSLTQWRDRVMFLRRAEGDEWPDLSEAALAETIGDWLAPA